MITIEYIQDKEEFELAVSISIKAMINNVIDCYPSEGRSNIINYCINKSEKLYNLSVKSEQFTAMSDDDNCYTGMVSFDSNGFIRLLYVLPEYQRQGIGSKLLQFAEKELADNSIRVAYVDSAPGSENFYRANGYNDSDYQQVKNGIIYTPMRKKLIDY